MFQNVLASIYSGILDFHQQAYKFFKKRGKLHSSGVKKQGDFNSCDRHCELNTTPQFYSNATENAKSIADNFLFDWNRIKRSSI